MITSLISMGMTVFGSGATPIITKSVALQPGREWLGSFGVEGLLMLVIFALVGGIFYRKRQTYPHPLPLFPTLLACPYNK